MLKIKSKCKYKLKNNRKPISQRVGMMGVMGVGPLLMVVGIVLVAGLTHGSSPADAYAATDQKTGGSSQESSSGGSLKKNSKSSTPTKAAAAKSAASATAAKAAAVKATAMATKKPATVANVAANSVALPSAAPAVSRSASLYAYPDSDIATNATAYASANPSEAGAMERLAQTPLAVWLTGASSDAATANAVVSNAAANGKIAQLVLYNIPERDCGSYSAGGASSDAAYEAWVNSIASAIGSRQAIVIVEPDALAGMDCLSGADQQSRLSLISYATASLRSRSNAAIYIDAGNSNWQSAATMASRLNSAGISQATGFSLNVSNFYTTASSNAYGVSLSNDLGGKHFVVDTSRNGNGPTSDNQWCNPAGMAFGQTPTLSTGQSLVDAYLWIKGPGESDGSCGPDQMGTAAPSAGAWWPQYALMLANNSGW